MEWIIWIVMSLMLLIIVSGSWGIFTNFGFDKAWAEASDSINTDPCWDDPYVDELMLACAADDHRIGCVHPDCKNGPADPDWRRKRFFGKGEWAKK